MSIIDQLGGELGGAPDGRGNSGGLLSGIIGMLNSQPGGVSGLAQLFAQNGLGHLLSSWIGNGENLPISADQIKNVLGHERLAEFAAKSGISSEAASVQLADLLPNVLDKLSPNGEFPEAGSDLMSKGMSMLSGLFPNKTRA